MKKRKIITLIIGIFSIITLLMGICFLFASKTFAVVCGIVLICLSLASGIIIPNPISPFGLILGICMALCQPMVIGIIFVCIGLLIALINLIIWLRAQDKYKHQNIVEVEKIQDL